MGRYWHRRWICLSLGLLLATAVTISLFVTTYYHRIRRAVGLPYHEKWKPQPAAEPASEAGLAVLLAQGHPLLLALLGGIGLTVGTGLMVFKPF